MDTDVKPNMLACRVETTGGFNLNALSYDTACAAALGEISTFIRRTWLNSRESKITTYVWSYNTKAGLQLLCL